MTWTFQGIIAGAVDPQISCVVGALLDFITYALYESHATETLSRMQEVLEAFHSAKDIFIELGVCENFSILKFHSLLHYVEGIKRLGSADGFNSEHPEWLHINFAKCPYLATNSHEYVGQMTKSIQWQEALVLQNNFLEWCFQGYQPTRSPSASVRWVSCRASIPILLSLMI